MSLCHFRMDGWCSWKTWTQAENGAEKDSPSAVDLLNCRRAEAALPMRKINSENKFDKTEV